MTNILFFWVSCEEFLKRFQQLIVPRAITSRFLYFQANGWISRASNIPINIPFDCYSHLWMYGVLRTKYQNSMYFQKGLILEFVWCSEKSPWSLGCLWPMLGHFCYASSCSCIEGKLPVGCIWCTSTTRQANMALNGSQTNQVPGLFVSTNICF